MGFLKKLVKKSIGGKLLSKAVKHDPLGKKLLSKDPIAKATGIGQSSGKKKGGLAAGIAKQQGMATGGPAKPMVRPPVRPTTPMGRGLDRMAGKRFNRP